MTVGPNSMSSISPNGLFDASLGESKLRRPLRSPIMN